MHSNLNTVDVALFPILGVLADKAEPMLCPLQGKKARYHRNVWLTASNLDSFSLFSLRSWFMVPAGEPMPYPFFTCPALFLRHHHVWGWEGRGKKRNLPPVAKAVIPSSCHLKPFYQHRVSWTFLHVRNTVVMLCYLEQELETHTQKAQQMPFQPSIKSNFCSKHLKSG